MSSESGGLLRAEFGYPGPLRDRLHAVDEGYATLAEWRAAHEMFWQVGVDDGTLVVLERFRVVG